MPDLPHGWRMRNSTVELTGPPIEQLRISAESDDEDDSVSEGLDIKPDSEGWEDVEDDTEAVNIKCLVCAEAFPVAKAMVDHCKNIHEFDFVKVQKDNDLDFYGSIKLVNYIRKAVSTDGAIPSTGDKDAWSGDEYLPPFLENDALLFSLDDLDGGAAPEAGDGDKA